MTAEIAQDRVGEFVDRVRSIRESLHQVVVGQDETIDLLLTCALTGSHALLVGVPGLAKTLMVNRNCQRVNLTDSSRLRRYLPKG